jgi:hypothetical protein
VIITSQQTIDTKLARWHYGLAKTMPAGKRERLFIASCCLSFKIMPMGDAPAAASEHQSLMSRERKTKLFCVPCDRTATDKQHRHEANYSCGP